MKQILEQLKNEMIKDFGKPCKDYSRLCGSCIAWEAYRTLEELSNI